MKWLVPVGLVLLGLEQTAPPTFRAGVEAVRLDVLVTDGSRPVAGLIAADFELTDAGVPQRIESVAIADVPVSMLLTLDTSASVKGAGLITLKDAAGAALAQLGRGDRAALLAFDNVIEMKAGWRHGAQSTHEGLVASEAEGGTSLYDAAFAALTMRDEAAGHRNLILLFSDGTDTTSWLPPSAVLEQAQRTDAVVYSVSLRGASDRRRLYRRSGLELLWRPSSSHATERFLTDLANVTGGKALAANSLQRLRGAFASVVTEFRTRYLLHYTPHGSNTAGWHPIEVKLRNRKGIVTARKGYLR